MPILDLQKRLREVGRIRMGDKQLTGGKTKNGDPASRPNKLDKFRLTSQDKGVLTAAAAMYGGSVKPWADQPGHFELYVSSEEIPILVSPIEETQWYEQWTGGGCTHRCDGETNTITDKECSCDPEKRDCKLTTRISVMLPELPSLGVWRLETHSWYAATEMPTALQMLRSSARNGEYIPASLAIEHRTVIRDGQTKKFIVPVLRLRRVLSDVLNIRGQQRLPMEQQMLPNGVSALPPVMGNGEKAKTFGLKKEQADELKGLLPADQSLPAVLAEAYDLGVRSFAAMKEYLTSGVLPGVEVKEDAAEDKAHVGQPALTEDPT